eukprot:CCRYP_006443-RA/>CCRYP_006443-RA protein AED:0.40 eAED:0.40 QI:133/1/1/1/1/1/2/344/285
MRTTTTRLTFLPTALLLLLSPLPSTSFSPPASITPRHAHTQLHLFPPKGIPPTPTARDQQAISSLKSALSLPRPTLLECEFPPLSSLNKLGDGSLRSSLQVEDANVAFVAKLAKELASPFGPMVVVYVSSSASNSLVAKVRAKVKKNVYSLKEEGMQGNVKNDRVCILMTPSSPKDYRIARELAESGCKTVIVNGLFKDPKSIPPYAKMAYYLKPLTYNSQIAGYLIRTYPQPWKVVDVVTNKVLGTFSDAEILVEKTNTPDLRESVRLAQKSVDERAIRARSGR